MVEISGILATECHDLVDLYFRGTINETKYFLLIERLVAIPLFGCVELPPRIAAEDEENFSSNGIASYCHRRLVALACINKSNLSPDFAFRVLADSGIKLDYFVCLFLHLCDNKLSIPVIKAVSDLREWFDAIVPRKLQETSRYLPRVSKLFFHFYLEISNSVFSTALENTLDFMFLKKLFYKKDKEFEKIVCMEFSSLISIEKDFEKFSKIYFNLVCDGNDFISKILPEIPLTPEFLLDDGEIPKVWKFLSENRVDFPAENFSRFFKNKIGFFQSLSGFCLSRIFAKNFNVFEASETKCENLILAQCLENFGEKFDEKLLRPRISESETFTIQSFSRNIASRGTWKFLNFSENQYVQQENIFIISDFSICNVHDNQFPGNFSNWLTHDQFIFLNFILNGNPQIILNFSDEGKEFIIESLICCGLIEKSKAGNFKVSTCQWKQEKTKTLEIAEKCFLMKLEFNLKNYNFQPSKEFSEDFRIDSRIMSILKSSKFQSQKSLIQEISRFTDSSDEIILKRVESLVSRDFIRKQNWNEKRQEIFSIMEETGPSFDEIENSLEIFYSYNP